MKNDIVPVITGDWQLLYKPGKTGCYVNDHSLILADDGSWHLFGITRDGVEVEPDRERWFTYGRSPGLISDSGFEEVCKVCDTGLRAWAPSVVYHEDRYYMYYGPAPLRLATSYELSHWMENPVYLHDAPLDSCHRDSMVLKLDDGSWLMYATGLHNRYGVISVFQSDDLINWHFIKYALKTSGNARFIPSWGDTGGVYPPWGATESPFVVKKEDLYYLFITFTSGSLESYHNTLVFKSDDPLDFGKYTGDNENDIVIAKLHTHAPEVVCDNDGQWYITTCGWRNHGTPIEGGVAIAKLDWMKKSEVDSKI